MSYLASYRARVAQRRVITVPCIGGVDVASPLISAQPGSARFLVNFEPQLGGGYRRINGYCRLDGRDSPADAVYHTVVVADGTGISVNDVLTGDTSGATSVVVAKNGNTLAVTNLSGDYQDGETANGTTIVAKNVANGENDASLHASYRLAAENWYRQQITAVPGTGDVLGAVYFDGQYYALRHDGTKVKLYTSSASGWVEVPMFRYIVYNSGTFTATSLVEGDTINGETSGATAIVKRIVKNNGSYGTDASGYLVLGSVSGSFINGENLREGTTVVCVARSADQPIQMPNPGGRFQFVEYNFYGSSGTKRLYACDGANFAWEFDGEVLTPIFFQYPDYNPSWNTPKHIVAFRNHLFLSFPNGSLAHSSIGEPLVFSALLGAAEFGLGSECTGLAVRAGEVLAIYTKNKTYGLYGTDASNWELKTISESYGAFDYTVQTIGEVYALDHRGVSPLERVQAFGDFEGSTVSRNVKSLLDKITDGHSVVGSAVIKKKNQYRVFFSNGYGLIMTHDSYTNEPPSFSFLKFSHTPTCVSCSERSDGSEVVLFGDSNGYVYEMDVGRNFDGDEITAVYRTQYITPSENQVLCSFFRVYIDIDAAEPFYMYISHSVTFDSPYKASNVARSWSWDGKGGYWGESNWDSFYWGGSEFSSKGIPIYGTGRNIAFSFISESATTEPFVIQTFQVQYAPRRLVHGE